MGRRNAPSAKTGTHSRGTCWPECRAGNRSSLFECCGNGGVGMHGLVGAARWGGVAARSAARKICVGLRTAREVVFFGADGADERLRGNRYPGRFARSLPVADALSPGVLLADTMNGDPLPREHGGPLRLIVPGFYGVAQVKWVERIEVWPSRFAGWYQAKDYVTVRGVETPSGILHTASVIGRMRLKSIVTRVDKGTRTRTSGFTGSPGMTAPRRSPRSRSAWTTPFQPAELLPLSPPVRTASLCHGLACRGSRRTPPRLPGAGCRRGAAHRRGGLALPGNPLGEQRPGSAPHPPLKGGAAATSSWAPRSRTRGACPPEWACSGESARRSAGTRRGSPRRASGSR